MNILEKLTSVFGKAATRYVFAEIPTARVTHEDGSAGISQPVEAGKHYFRIVLAEMFLKKDRDWFASWHPAAHSVVKLTFGDNAETLTHVAGESLLAKVQANLDRVIPLNHHLTPLLPFNGGTVEFEAGLLAMKGGDDLKAFLGFLGKFSEKLMVPSVSTALNMADSLADGLFSLVGATDGELKIGLHQTWTGAEPGGGNPLRSGHFAIVTADAKSFDPAKLAVVKGRLHYGQPGGPTVPLSGYDYMLLRVEHISKRDDSLSFSYIKEPYDEMLAALDEDNIEQAKSHSARAQKAARKAKDLTAEDRKKIVAIIKQEFANSTGAGSGLARDTRDIDSLWDSPIDAEIVAEIAHEGDESFGLVK